MELIRAILSGNEEKALQLVSDDSVDTEFVDDLFVYWNQFI